MSSTEDIITGIVADVARMERVVRELRAEGRIVLASQVQEIVDGLKGEYRGWTGRKWEERGDE